jgi:3-hydroxyacyl-[acyl-carrier-protein] dehydratase
MLKDSFYTLSETTTDINGNFLCSVRFNPLHVIYQVHFQGNPITPGACIIQIIKELSQLLTHKCLLIKEIKNLKFINAIIPNDFPEVIFQISLQANENGDAYLSNVIVLFGEIVFAKLNLRLSVIDA